MQANVTQSESDDSTQFQSMANRPTALELASPVILASPYPPPIGGNTVHVQRLAEDLTRRSLQVNVLDYTGSPAPDNAPPGLVISVPANVAKRVLGLIDFRRNIDGKAIIHYHVAEMTRFRFFAPLLFAIFAGHAQMLTIHSGYFVRLSQGRLRQAYLRVLLRGFSRIVCVSEEQRDFITSSLAYPRDRTSVIPAFIPSTVRPECLPAAVAEIPSEPIRLAISGYLTPAYGHHILAAALDLLDDSVDVHTVFAFYGPVDEEYAEGIFATLDGRENVTIVRNLSPDEFVAVLDTTDVFVRATETDGDAVTVREALALDCTILASDCVARPSECELFATDDPEQLATLINRYGSKKDLHEDVPGDDTHRPSGAEKLLEVYSELDRGRTGS